MKMKKGSLWVCFVALVFGLMMVFSMSACQKKDAATETPAVTETAPAPAPDASTATTGGTEAPAAEAPATSGQ
jgi:hypothetical protein